MRHLKDEHERVPAVAHYELFRSSLNCTWPPRSQGLFSEPITYYTSAEPPWLMGLWDCQLSGSWDWHAIIKCWCQQQSGLVKLFPANARAGKSLSPHGDDDDSVSTILVLNRCVYRDACRKTLIDDTTRARGGAFRMHQNGQLEVAGPSLQYHACHPSDTNLHWRFEALRRRSETAR
jgi:hypothetical protein